MGRSIRPGATGVGRSAANLLDALADHFPPGSITAFVTRDAPAIDARVRAARAPLPTPSEYARAFWEQTLVPSQCVARRLDVYHSPNFILPFALPTPAIVTVHDLTYLTASLHRRRSHLYLSVMTHFAVHRARAVVTVSQHVARQIRAHFPAVAARLHVIPNGVDPLFRAPRDPDRLFPDRTFQEAYGVDRPYILYVGTLEPRKNLPSLVTAFEQAVTQSGLPHLLVLAGPRGWKLNALDAVVARSPLASRIWQPGYIPEHLLPSCYAGADLFVYPSLDEGFGLPPLEAMTMGVPVITSNTSSLPEVVGDAALLVDPNDGQALAQGIIAVLTDRTIADRLRAAGPPWAARFSWASTARQYADVYAQVAAGGRA